MCFSENELAAARHTEFGTDEGQLFADARENRRAESMEIEVCMLALADVRMCGGWYLRVDNIEEI